jgi:hypothetical protein
MYDGFPMAYAHGIYTTRRGGEGGEHPRTKKTNKRSEYIVWEWSGRGENDARSHWHSY